MKGQLKGPHRAEALEIVGQAKRMGQVDAERISDSWESDGDLENYYATCERIFDAMAQTGRSLPIGWFETEFAGLGWVTTTKALHAVADAVSATLVMDCVSAQDFNLLVSHFKAIFQYA